MNCSFNIRYKPRTTRAFTKSDLTVYDSAGNTALRGLKVYGKSEVMGGAIKSAGEGYAVVDLGTLMWSIGGSLWYSTDLQSSIKPVASNDDIANVKCAIYQTSSRTDILGRDMRICVTSTGVIGITNSNYTDATAFQTAMSGVLLCYELADPTQGNTIAVKTDDGSGTDGTMAVFSTGTPIRGIPDTDVRDVMTWDGISGEVAKNCAKVRLADLTWNYEQAYQRFVARLAGMKNTNTRTAKMLCSIYQTISDSRPISDVPDKSIYNTNAGGDNQDICVHDSDYTTVSDFVTALGDAELVYELASPTTEQLTTAENASIAGLRTFERQTHVQNNAQTDMTVNYTIRVPTIN